MLGILLSFCGKKLKFTAHPSLKWLIFAQYQHHPKVKAVRMNGKISEVKQPQDQSNSKMGDHLGSIHFVFFQWQKYSANLPNFTKKLELRKNSNKEYSKDRPIPPLIIRTDSLDTRSHLLSCVKIIVLTIRTMPQFGQESSRNFCIN